jgi:hypothetical protein
LLVFDGSRGEAKADRVAADFRKFQGSRLVAAIRSLAFVEGQHCQAALLLFVHFRESRHRRGHARIPRKRLVRRDVHPLGRC